MMSEIISVSSSLGASDEEVIKMAERVVEILSQGGLNWPDGAGPPEYDELKPMRFGDGQ